MALLISPATSTLDDRWFDILTQTAGIALEAWSILGPASATLARQKIEFYTNIKQPNPDLRPTRLDKAALAALRTKLQVLADTIDAEESQPQVRTAYLMRIAELQANLDMLAAANRNDTAAFAAANRVIYGDPDPDIFAAVCEWFRAQALAVAHSSDAQLAAASTAILNNLPPGKSPRPLGPTPEVFAVVRDQHFGPRGFYTQLFDGLAIPTGTVTAQIGDPLLRRLLYNLNAIGYKLTDSPDTYWGVRYETNAIMRPRNYELTPQEFMGVAGHEIGSHLLERLNGLRQPLKLLSVGLDRYECGNEGRAVIREQVAYPLWEMFTAQPRWHELLCRHLAICLGLGYGARVPRSFSEVYAIIYAATYLQAPVARHAHHYAWNLVTRALKGTDGTGGAYLKDMVYLQGNLACWQLFAATSPDVIMAGDTGKFDITNPRHQQLLASLRP